MPNLNVRFSVDFSARVVRLVLIGAMLLASASQLASESVSLTTYYPAPSGVYTQLIATSNSYMARDAGFLDVGTNVAPPGEIKLAVAGPGFFVSPNIGTTGGVIIKDAPGDPNAAYLQFTNNAETREVAHIQGLETGGLALMDGNVGIGTNSPVSALSVNGGVQMGYDAAACTSAKAGTMRWYSGRAQVCDGVAWTSLAATTLTVTQTYVTAWESGGTASCPAGTALVAGGVNCAGSGSVFVVVSYPANTTQWYAYCGSLSNQVWGTHYLVTATVYAQCQ